MKKSRVEYVDILRAFALIYMIIYHVFVVAHIKISNEIVSNILSFGGLVGVNIFFVISGFSIYKYLEKKNGIKYLDFLKGRIKRVGPHYYISIVVALLFTTSVVYLAKDHILNILFHILFIHNWFPSSAGAISGVLWTMGVTVQFYVLAPILKKYLDKYPIRTLILSIIFSIVTKYITYKILYINNYDEWYYFNYGQQIFNTLDAFVLGMFVARLKNNNLKIKNIFGLGLGIISLIFIILLGSNSLPILNDSSVYSLTIKGILFFIVLHIIISFIIYFLSNLDYKENKLSKLLLKVAKHEYSIYIWHLLVLNNLLTNLSIVNFINNTNPVISLLSISIVLILIGILIDKIISNINFDNIFKKSGE